MAGLLDLIQPSPDGGMGLLGSVLSRVDAMKRRAGGLLSPDGINQLVASLAEDARSNANLAGQGIENSQSVMPGMASLGAHQIYDAGSPAALALQTVYHGSPHTFDKFDMSKIGTGEGAQAFGHGLYFADNPKVAMDYRNTLADTLETNVDAPFIEKRAAQMALTFGNNTADGAIAWLRRYADSGTQHTTPPVSPEVFKSVIKRFQNGEFRPGGNLYRVDIPDEAIGRMLQWDKPLSEQPQAVRDALKPLQDEYRKNPAFENPYIAPGATGAEIYKELINSSYQKYAGGGHDEQAAYMLKQLGIPGIRYLDQGSRGAGQGTYNTVLFDPNLAKILGRE